MPKYGTVSQVLLQLVVAQRYQQPMDQRSQVQDLMGAQAQSRVSTLS